jgi:hypothetical protein
MGNARSGHGGMFDTHQRLVTDQIGQIEIRLLLAQGETMNKGIKGNRIHPEAALAGGEHATPRHMGQKPGHVPVDRGAV